MKTIRIIALIIFSCLTLSFAEGKSYKVKDVPNMRLSDNNAHVSNPDGILSEGTVSQVNNILNSMRSASGVDAAVVVLSSIGSSSAEDFSMELSRTWGIGNKDRDDGLLILLVTSDRFIRFEVGYGLEGTLPDAICKRIQTQRMMPYLKTGDWDGAILAGVKGVNEYVTDPDSGLRAEADSTLNTGESVSIGAIIMLALFVLMFLPFAHLRKMSRCPRCKAHMKVVNQFTEQLANNKVRETKVYLCPKCGYSKTQSDIHNNYNGGWGGGMIGGGMLGGGFGGGFGGGGFGGGSFGGGSFGGGGATSRF
jgi:uncharacterized protein